MSAVMEARVEAAVDWLIADDSAYASEPANATRAAQAMLAASDAVAARYAAAADRAIAILDRGHNRRAFADSLAEELKIEADDRFMAAADRVLMRLYERGYIVRSVE